MTRMRVRDLMSSPAVAVTPETPLKEAGRVLVEHGVSGVPVVADGRLVGVVAQADIVGDEQRAEDEQTMSMPRRVVARLRRLLLRREPQPPPRTVGDAMTSPALTVDAQASAICAAWQMTHADVHRLPVVDGGRLVGVITRTDLVRAFVRGDDDVRREIVTEVLPALGVSSDDVRVTVADGIVTLRGDVEDEVEVRCLPHAVRGVIGVVDVVAEVTARHGHTPFDRMTSRL